MPLHRMAFHQRYCMFKQRTDGTSASLYSQEQEFLSEGFPLQSDDVLRTPEINQQEVISYFFIDSHPYHGIRTLDEQIFGQGISSSLLERLKSFVLKDLFSMQKLDIPSYDVKTSDVMSSQNVSNMDNIALFQRPKMTLLSEVGLTLITLFFKVREGYAGGGSPSLQVHCAVTFVINSCKDSSRIYFIFPLLRDHLLLTQQTITTNLNAVEENRRNKIIDASMNNTNSNGSCYASTPGSDVEGGTVVHECSRHIPKMTADINGWLRAGIVWQHIRPCETLLPVLLDSSSSTIGSNIGLAKQLAGFVSAALEHHCCIIRADDKKLVLRWLHTLSLFLKDAQLAMASTICARCVTDIIPDLTLQGTICSVAAVLTLFPLFRRPLVVLDVSRRLEESAHAFPIFTHLRFKEYRLAAMRGEKIDRFGSVRTRVTSLMVSPLVVSICSRVCCALRVNAPQSPCGTVLNSAVSSPSREAPRSNTVEEESLEISQNTESVTPVYVHSFLTSFLTHLPSFPLPPPLTSFSTPPLESMLEPQLEFPITSDNSISVSNIDNYNNENNKVNIRNALILLANWRREMELRT
ncbi:hypothetical protein LSM04_007943 [Trypanosoma melophagium]|uniref:uncharacterized protein n=1 Tax=Trypanosoma melophagium TaxID=715481 RepID=UPI00351A637A|nr:hypothetical protein LSM04_007943 [Trypanosoma melophagium]